MAEGWAVGGGAASVGTPAVLVAGRPVKHPHCGQEDPQNIFHTSNMAIRAVRNTGDGRILLPRGKEGTSKTRDGSVRSNIRHAASRSLRRTHASA